jgi:hypothetical protein
MPRGARPGERRGGRAKGTPNKATVEKLAIAERVRNRSRRGRKKSAIEVLEEMMNVFYDLAAYYAPAVGSMEPNPNQNEEMFCKYFRLTFQAAKTLAPYQSPKLRAVSFTSAPEPEQDLDCDKTRRYTLWPFGKPQDVRLKRGNGDDPDGLDGSSTTH